MTDKDDAVASYVQRQITNSGYDETIDDKVYTHKSLWNERKPSQDLNIGNLVLIEDWPVYIGSVWKRAAVDVIFPIAGLQAMGLNTSDIETSDNGLEQEIFDFFIPPDALFAGTYIKFTLQGQKQTTSIAGEFKLYVETANGDDRTEVHTFDIPSANRRIADEYLLKIVEGDVDHDFAVNCIKSNEEDLTQPYPANVMIPQIVEPGVNVRFVVTFKSATTGEIFTLKHANAIWFAA